jgi:hypothetical protein
MLTKKYEYKFDLLLILIYKIFRIKGKWKKIVQTLVLKSCLKLRMSSCIDTLTTKKPFLHQVHFK